MEHERFVQLLMSCCIGISEVIYIGLLVEYQTIGLQRCIVSLHYWLLLTVVQVCIGVIRAFVRMISFVVLNPH